MRRELRVVASLAQSAACCCVLLMLLRAAAWTAFAGQVVACGALRCAAFSRTCVARGMPLPSSLSAAFSPLFLSSLLIPSKLHNTFLLIFHLLSLRLTTPSYQCSERMLSLRHVGISSILLKRSQCLSLCKTTSPSYSFALRSFGGGTKQEPEPPKSEFVYVIFSPLLPSSTLPLSSLLSSLLLLPLTHWS